ncbi:MAG: phosphoribosylformylglycinamidine synthase subunit PurL [Firmicutes bacterium]|nr:phosphoribosylformylglycinamidine synthase subunit PurL [Bacillota bacterium]
MSLSASPEARWTSVGLTEEEYREIVRRLGREPNDVELGLFGVMWSEHCSYKSSRKLLKILPSAGERVRLGPGENAGVLDIGGGWAVALRIESHNHPSAVEPYQGAATGVGGIVRDILSTGARPVALLDALSFGLPDSPRDRALLRGIVEGIGGYGNCLGVPTVGGETVFHSGYDGQPLVNVMCVGLVRLERLVRGRAEGEGNVLMLVGARTGRDGIHGASLLASRGLSEGGEDKRPAVQVGDPFIGKRLIEACAELVEAGWVAGLTDLGAAGLTSAAAEAAGRAGRGVVLELDRVPLREDGMTPYEIMLSESQERMLIIATPEGAGRVEAACRRWGLEAAAVGRVTGDGYLRVRWRGREVAAVPVRDLTEAAPAYERPWRAPAPVTPEPGRGVAAGPSRGGAAAPSHGGAPRPADPSEAFLDFLSSVHVASRAPVYRRYDHEVQTNTVLRPGHDAAVIRVRGTRKGLALATDGAGRWGGLDPYYAGAIAVAEAARNVSCVGAEPIGLTDCLNFGNPEDPHVMWQFRRALEGIRDACLALGIPVTGGNVSFYNETDGRQIPPTPVVGMVGLIEDIERLVPSSPRCPGALWLLGGGAVSQEGSLWQMWREGRVHGQCPPLDLSLEAAVQALVREAAGHGWIRAAHDVSDGGLLVAAAEMALSPEIPWGLRLQLPEAGDAWTAAYGEGGARVLVVPAGPEAERALMRRAEERAVPCREVGRLTEDGRVIVKSGRDAWVDVAAERAARAWKEGWAWLL